MWLCSQLANFGQFWSKILSSLRSDSVNQARNVSLQEVSIHFSQFHFRPVSSLFHRELKEHPFINLLICFTGTREATLIPLLPRLIPQQKQTVRLRLLPQPLSLRKQCLWISLCRIRDLRQTHQLEWTLVRVRPWMTTMKWIVIGWIGVSQFAASWCLSV